MGAWLVGVLVVVLLAVGARVSFSTSSRIPWVLRRFLPSVCYGLAAGLLLALLRGPAGC